MDLSTYIRDIPDWPQEGIVFKDITPLLASPEGFREAIDTLGEQFAGMGVTKVLGAEARGFIFGGALAYTLGAGFTPARKPGKLPWDTTSVTYDLEYGTDTLEVHADAFGPDDVVLIVD
ncbi:MAG: adenine phosphoribosyltransferase, partial [Coriobacteriales bacterium]|nr:adenine phosphoribosyltransferase [Coriobacteriales bacterium]